MPRLRLRTSNCSLLLIHLPRKDERLSQPGWLTYSGWFTHISGHPSVAGRAQDSESSPVTDRRSTTVPHNQLNQPSNSYISPVASLLIMGGHFPQILNLSQGLKIAVASGCLGETSVFAARCYASVAYVVMQCLCVCHIREFCQNESTYHQTFPSSGSHTILLFPCQTA